MSGYEYPDDEFDGGQDDDATPVGVHRAPVPAWRSWMPLLIVIVVVPLLAWGAVTLLGMRSGSAEDSADMADMASPAAPEPGEEQSPATDAASQAPTPAESPTPEASADLTTGITVLNGTTINGLAARTGGKLTNAGFTAVTVSQTPYTAADPAGTTVYYAAPEHATSAQAVAEALGSVVVVESAENAQSNPIVVVLRTDYQE